MAPGARIAFVDTTVGTSGYAYPDDITLLNVGRTNVADEANMARIHSASWGVRGQNTYTSQASTFDDYMFQHDDIDVCVEIVFGGFKFLERVIEMCERLKLRGCRLR